MGALSHAIEAVDQILMGTLTDLSMYGNPRPTSDPTPVVQMVKDSLQGSYSMAESPG